jgi:hypothetical protein
MNPTTYGTSHFTSRSAAVRYYKGYGYDDVKAAVAAKIKDGEIHIGKPPLKAGQRLTTVDGGKRYAITEANPGGLPIGRTVTVKAIRRRDGRVDLYRA